MHRPSIVFALTGAALAAAQGFSSECTDISLNDYWLVATCPTGSGEEITSSVFLAHKISNNNGNLEWTEDGEYGQSCEDCTLDGASLNCGCIINSRPSLQDTTLNLEEHIANYEGHLLSNQTGAITTIPANSDIPVPSDFAVQLRVSTLNNTCENSGGTLSLNNPTDCFYLNIGVDIIWLAGISSTNEGWEIVAFEDQECTGDPVYTFTEENDDECAFFVPGARAFSVTPLWNADY
ncbi:Cyanovirin-N [Aspergillus cavernicola]|uniref:Cyanovirin-N n=1 Tax=Aspergillus cavernicola TaxID=176166 RepID=A0ABR4IBA7_9EURO